MKNLIHRVLPDQTNVRYLGPDLYGMVRIYCGLDGYGVIVDTALIPDLIAALWEVHRQSQADRIIEAHLHPANDGKHPVYLQKESES